MTGKDHHLILKAKAGDSGAYGQLVRKYQNKVLYLAFDLCSNYDDAKDVAQDTFVRAFEKIHQFQERSQFSTWLYRIAVNLSMDLHRKRQNRQHRSLQDHEFDIDKKQMMTSDVETPLTLVEKNEQRVQIDRALNCLSPNQRTATVLKYFHQMNSREISGIMGCSEGTVRNHIFRALKNLKRQLKKPIPDISNHT